MDRERSRQWRTVILASVAAIGAGMALAAQNNEYPDPAKLPDPGVVASPPAKKSNVVARPAGAMPRAPRGFTVSLLAEGLPGGARSMVTAPNGDLFIGGYTSNTVMVLRDGSKDGRYNTKFIYLPSGRAAPGNPTTGGVTRGTTVAPPIGDNRGGGRGGRGNNLIAQAAPASRGATPQAPAARGAVPAAGPNPQAIDPATGLPRGEKSTRDRALPCKMVVPPVTGATALRQANGMAFHNGYLYFANTDSVIRYKYALGDTQATDVPERVAILPSGGVNNARNIIFNRAGTKMYVSIGSNSNDLAGEDCRRATIMEFNPDGTGGRIYASGLRNPLGLAWQPNSETLWTTVTEREGPNFGDDLVPDFATALVEDGFYGWPYAYIGKHYDPKYLGGQASLVKTTLTPDVPLPAHSAPTSLAFYAPSSPALSRQYPPAYWGLFLALNGSTNNSSTARGFKVVFVPFLNGKAVAASVVDFLIGFLVDDGKDAKSKAITYWGRPTAMAIGSDGSLLVLDDADPSNPNNNNSRLWKVTYNGAPRAVEP